MSCPRVEGRGDPKGVCVLLGKFTGPHPFMILFGTNLPGSLPEGQRGEVSRQSRGWDPVLSASKAPCGCGCVQAWGISEFLQVWEEFLGLFNRSGYLRKLLVGGRLGAEGSALGSRRSAAPGGRARASPSCSADPEPPLKGLGWWTSQEGLS